MAVSLRLPGRLAHPLVWGTAAVLVIGGGGYAWAETRDAGTTYRTALARTGDVERTLSLSGTVDSAARRDLSFGTSGTVAKVLVHPGQHVAAGEALATLDPTALHADVLSAESTLANARAQLASDEVSQASAVSQGSGGTTGSGGTGSAGGNGGSGGATPSKGHSPSGATGDNGTGKGGTDGGTSGTPAALADLAKQQQAVLDAQTAATRAIDEAKAKLAARAQACAATTPPDGSTDGTGGTSGTGGTDGTGGTGGTTGGGGAGDDQCAAALDAAAQAQDRVADAQAALADALADLSGTLAKAQQSAQQSAAQIVAQARAEAARIVQQAQQQAQHSAQSAQQSAQQASKSPASTPSASPSGGSVTAARLAADQAQIDRSTSDLVAARLAARAATLRAPVAGEVVAVDVARGDAADTSSTAVTVVGAGATTVTGSVSLAQVPSVKRGQTARVLLSGATKALTGTVTQVGLVPASDSNGSTTYPVTITVPDQPGTAVPQGTTASVEVVTGTAHHVVTVPTSAVSSVGDDRATVQVLDDGEARTKVVTVGIVGGTLTSITSGLAAGQRVVLADLDASLPSSDSSDQRGFGGGLGGGLGGGFKGPVIVRNGGGPVVKGG